MKSLKESLFDDDLISRNPLEEYAHPKDKGELIKSIRFYIKSTKPKEGDIVDLNWIDISNIKYMDYLFDSHILSIYNYDVSKWDVSKVINMSGCFFGCKYFNCDLSKWDVSRVREMGRLFQFCEKFEGRGLKNWNIKSVESMVFMFDGCFNFNEDISKWNTKNVSNMIGTFYNCLKFDQDLSKWDVSNCINYSTIFSNCPKMKEENKPHFK